jgi:DNA repair protein RecO (recombination protein O)
VYPTPAIVIGRINLGEADRILTLITPDYGKLRVSIRGVRKIRSRLAGHVELFSQVRLMLATGKSLDVVTSAELVHSVDSILGQPGEAQPELYALAEEFLATLDGSGQTALLELGLKLRLLATLGYQPELSHCVICNRSDAKRLYYLSIERGGLVDEGCGVAGGYRFDQRAIKLWRLAITLPLDRLQEIEGATELARDSLDLCDQFYEYHFGRRFSGGLLGV